MLRNPHALGSSLRRFKLGLGHRWRDVSPCRGTTTRIEEGIGGQSHRGAVVDGPSYFRAGSGRDVVQVRLSFLILALAHLGWRNSSGRALSDPDGLLELSPEQRDAGVVWRRPSEVFVNAKLFSPEFRPEDVVQRVVADCSLCASVIICLLHSRTHDSEVRCWIHTINHGSDTNSRQRCPHSIPVG